MTVQSQPLNGEQGDTCPHDFVPGEVLDDFGTQRWTCRRCDYSTAIAEGELP
jgi:DNA-directed RNA polymerase subunit N (RpoN/RPB10)